MTEIQARARAAKGPKALVLTPFFNERTHLETCVRSVLAQTHGNFEYLLVDNASTDGSGELADRLAEQDARIRVIHNPRTLPQLENFNLAMRELDADSQYVKMVLGDDWIYPRCLEEMIAVGEANPSTGIIGSYYIYWDNQVFAGGLPVPSSCVSGRQICREQLLRNYFFFGSPTALLYRGDVVRNRDPFFNEQALHADTEAGYEILREHDFGFAHEVLCFIRSDNASTLSRRKNYDWGYLDKYIVTRKYGATFLSEEEFTRAMKNISRQYWSKLGEAALFGQRSEYWEYHRRGLGTIGERLSPFRLARFVFRAFLKSASSPIWAALQIRDRVRHERSRARG